MKTFFIAAGIIGCAGVCLAFALRDVGEKPMVRDGQVEAAQALMREVREAARERTQSGGESQYPLAYCKQPEFDFGLMDPLTVGAHTFEIQNKGSVPLILQGGQSSCKCTLSDLKEAEVKPGETYPVKLVWNSGHASREFQQSATVMTNDPTHREIQLVVRGEVKAVLATVPSFLELDRLIPESGTQSDIVIFSQTLESIDIDRIELTSPHLSAEEIPPGDSPVRVAFDSELNTASAVAAVRVAYDGQAPVGPLNAKLRIFVRLPPEWTATASAEDQVVATATDALDNGDDSAGLPTINFPMQDDGTALLEVNVHGDVVRRLSLYGPIVKAAGFVDLGNLKAADSLGKQWTIIGRVRGDILPESVSAEISGIPGLKATAEVQTSDQVKYSFKLTITATEAMRPAIYDRQTAGMLRIKTPGLVGSELLEMPVNLEVLGKR